MSKKIVKLAVIRDNANEGCPFGLPINFACKSIGENINKLFPLNALENGSPEDKEKIKAANMRIFAWAIMMSEQPPSKCPYADDLFPDKEDKVNCSFGDTAAGQTGVGSALAGFPEYSTLFAGLGLDGIYSIPFAALTENNVMKNTYYGILSLQGELSSEKLISLAHDILNKRDSNKIE